MTIQTATTTTPRVCDALRKALATSRAVDLTRLMIVALLEDAGETLDGLSPMLADELATTTLGTLDVEAFLRTLGELLVTVRRRLAAANGDVAGISSAAAAADDATPAIAASGDNSNVS